MKRITIEVSPELELRLRDAAACCGEKVGQYVRRVLEERFELPEPDGGTVALDGLPPRSPEELLALARQQGVEPVTRFEDLLGDFWPEDESVDEFLEARRGWQWEGRLPGEASVDLDS